MGQLIRMDADEQSAETNPRSSAGFGYAVIIREAMASQNVSLRELQRRGVVNDRLRRQLFEKIEAGLISVTELQQVYDCLGIDPLRAMVAVQVLNNPQAYFDPCCETIAAYTEELGIALNEQLSAVRGDFKPIRRNLCRSHAQKITEQICAHHARVVEREETPIA
ncbi:hypothetical protein B2G71_19510 [Novosphingobium sp. PC22D]|uniref:HTH cro/C1-type domain-containing protein n=2 Tax=Novosphingobium TaxID=165696 RepID=A0ABQ2JTH6_9SPHN|nr:MULTISPECIES: hypothetical protein [Novosphingobium]MCJ2180088.1 hypothetical protein [Novosphingobium album (ex Hu et al. 2023)]PEQ11002.1 hypothetical protein B2G71_19510 [Novosphingobium sp. PC22D]GGN55454.1 hypothetical protein GCM10011349_32110 [Novosphingobium indicum]